MQARDFAFWLQGFFEITNPSEINASQTEMIKKHLNLVFKHEIDPSMGDQKHQQELNEIHNSSKIKLTPEQLQKFGPSPGPEYEFSSLHGWYHPKEGVPRC